MTYPFDFGPFSTLGQYVCHHIGISSRKALIIGDAPLEVPVVRATIRRTGHRSYRIMRDGKEYEITGQSHDDALSKVIAHPALTLEYARESI